MKTYEGIRHEDGTCAITVTYHGDSIICAWQLVNVLGRSKPLDWQHAPSTVALSILADHFLDDHADPKSRKTRRDDEARALESARCANEHMGWRLRERISGATLKLTSADIDRMIIEAGANMAPQTPAVMEAFAS